VQKAAGKLRVGKSYQFMPCTLLQWLYYFVSSSQWQVGELWEWPRV